MTILRQVGTIEFDPSKREHRDAVRAFMKRNAWVDSPLRFAYDPQFGSVAEQVKSKLLDWYIAKEVKPKKADSTGFRIHDFGARGVADETLSTEGVMMGAGLLYIPAQEHSVMLEGDIPHTIGSKELAFAMSGMLGEYKA